MLHLSLFAALAPFIALGHVGTGAPPADSLMSRGISRALATRRAAAIANVRYSVSLDLTSLDTARGRATVEFTRRRGGDVILDFRGPWVSPPIVNGVAVASAVSNGAHILLPAKALRYGTNAIEFRFKSLIAPAGASIIHFHDETDGNDYLYTLLVPSDANALFPCFDQPDLRARLTLSLTVPGSWIALANGTTERVDSGRATRTYAFRQTEPLPTYLMAFAAGPWTRFDDRGGPHHTVLYVRASRAKEVEVDSLQSQVGSALTSLERYFGIPYPFPQFQYLLAPAFPFGGMEHPGAVFFNEESFIYREPPTLDQRLGRRATIYHEVAHQWFGDYVTMRWFDDLWLKEGFATYMAAKMAAQEAQPNAWMSFYLRNKPAAYGVDATSGTTPIWQELANLDQAKSNYGAIVYNKAPGVLKQLNYLVGDPAFRAGVHAFLIAHAFGSATWRDLLDAIGHASHRPLREWGVQYMLRPGMPVIEQHLDIHDGRIRRLSLVQHPARPLSGRGVWPMKLELLIARAENGRSGRAASERISVTVHAETTIVAGAAGQAAPDFLFANANDYAYGMILLDPRSADWVEGHIGTVDDPFLRAMLWGSLWDLVANVRLAPVRFVDAALRELPRERNEQISARIVSHLARAVATDLSPAQRVSLLPRVEQVLLAVAGDSTYGYSIRKNALNAYIEVAGTPAALAHLDAVLDSASAAGIPLRQPTRWSIVTALVAHGAATADARLAAESQRDSSTGGKRHAFVAGAARPTADAKRSYFHRYLGDTGLNEEWVTASLRAFNDPSQSDLTLPYLVPALDTLPWIQQNRRIFFLGSWLAGFVGGQRSATALAAIDRFLANHRTLSRDLRSKILQARDDLDQTVRIRKAFAGSSSATD